MEELNLEEKLFEISCKIETIYPLSNILFNYLSLNIDSNTDKNLYLYNYKMNIALINAIMDGIDVIKQLSQ